MDIYLSFWVFQMIFKMKINYESYTQFKSSRALLYTLFNKSDKKRGNESMCSRRYLC